MSKEKRNDYFLLRDCGVDFRSAEAEAENTGAIVEGLAAVYEQPAVIYDPRTKQQFVETIKRGAFDDCDFTDVRLMINHRNDGIPLARSRHNNNGETANTMLISPEEDGVHIRASLDVDNNEEARKAVSAVKRRDLTGMSMLMYVEKKPDCERWYKRDGVVYRDIYKVRKVAEFSLVNTPAYEGTNIEARSLDSVRLALDSANAALDNTAPAKRDYTQKILLKKYGVKTK